MENVDGGRRTWRETFVESGLGILHYSLPTTHVNFFKFPNTLGSFKYKAKLNSAWLMLDINSVALPKPHAFGVVHVRAHNSPLQSWSN